MKTDAKCLHSSLKTITDILVYDITNPPLASRSYAYPCIAAYYAYIPFSKNNHPITPDLNGWKYEQIEVDTSTIDAEFSSISALLETSKNHIYSQDRLQHWIDSVYTFYKKNLSKKRYTATSSYGEKIADQIKRYAGTDGLKEIRTMSKFSFSKAEKGKWIPHLRIIWIPLNPTGTSYVHFAWIRSKK